MILYQTVVEAEGQAGQVFVVVKTADVPEVVVVEAETVVMLAEQEQQDKVIMVHQLVDIQSHLFLALVEVEAARVQQGVVAQPQQVINGALVVRGVVGTEFNTQGEVVQHKKVLLLPLVLY